MVVVVVVVVVVVDGINIGIIQPSVGASVPIAVSNHPALCIGGVAAAGIGFSVTAEVCVVIIGLMLLLTRMMRCLLMRWLLMLVSTVDARIGVAAGTINPRIAG